MPWRLGPWASLTVRVPLPVRVGTCPGGEGRVPALGHFDERPWSVLAYLLLLPVGYASAKDTALQSQTDKLSEDIQVRINCKPWVY